MPAERRSGRRVVSASPPLRAVADGVLVRVRVTPRARRTGITGLGRDAEGTTHVAAAVTAVPAQGAANAALIQLLAKAWRHPKRALSVASGAASRDKSVHVAGDPDRLAALLTDWARGLDQRS